MESGSGSQGDAIPAFDVDAMDLEKCLDDPVHLYDDVYVHAILVNGATKNTQRVVLTASSPAFEATASMTKPKRFVPQPPHPYELRRGLDIEYGNGKTVTATRNWPRPSILLRKVFVTGPELRWTSTGRLFGASMVDEHGREVLGARLEQCHVAHLALPDELALMALLLFLKIPESFSIRYTNTSF